MKLNSSWLAFVCCLLFIYRRPNNCNFWPQFDLTHIHLECISNIFLLHFISLVTIFANKASLLSCVYGRILLSKGKAAYDGRNTKTACDSGTLGRPICWKFSERTWEPFTRRSKQAPVPNPALGKSHPTVSSYDPRPTRDRPSRPTITRVRRTGRRRTGHNSRSCTRAVLSSEWKTSSCFACRPLSTVSGAPRKSSSLPTRSSCCYRRRCRRCTSSSPNTIFRTEEIFQVKPPPLGVLKSLWFRCLSFFFRCEIWPGICELLLMLATLIWFSQYCCLINPLLAFYL